MHVSPRGQGPRLGSALLVLTLLAILAACASEATDPEAPTGGSTLVAAVVADIAIEWIEELSDSLESGEIDRAAAVWSDQWAAIGIPLSAGDAAVRPPATATDAMQFYSEWARLTFADCEPTDNEDSYATIRCTGTVSGPFPEALALQSFELPFRFIALHDGLSSVVTDFDAIQGTTNTWPAEGAFYTYEAFYQYAARVEGFSGDHQSGIGQPLPSITSAKAHVQLAREWIARGQPDSP